MFEATTLPDASHRHEIVTIPVRSPLRLPTAICYIQGMTLVVLALVGLFAAIGAWHGASRTVGWLLATIIATALCRPLGRPLESMTHILVGGQGLLNRFAAIALAWIGIVALLGLTLSLLAKRLKSARPALARHDRWAGGVIGGLEGIILALVLMWAPLALEPVARAQANAPGGPSPQARRALAAADAVRQSWLGVLAQSTNPLASSEILALAADFAVISRSPDAMAWFMATDVMQRIQTLPSVTEATRLFEQDPELRALYSERGISTDGLRVALNNPTVLRVLDDSTLIADVEPLLPALRTAIREARARAVPNP